MVTHTCGAGQPELAANGNAAAEHGAEFGLGDFHFEGGKVVDLDAHGSFLSEKNSRGRKLSHSL